MFSSINRSTCWRNRHNTVFQTERDRRLKDLQAQIAPLKAARLKLHAEINRLTFESVIAPQGDGQIHMELETAQQSLSDLKVQISPLQAEINQLTRQFWVTKEQVKAINYDLSASRYRQVEQDEAYYESPQVTMERLLMLEKVISQEIRELESLIQ